MKRKKGSKIIKLKPQKVDKDEPDDEKLESLLRQLIEELSKTDDEQDADRVKNNNEKKIKKADSKKIVHLPKRSREDNED